ncbi:MAG: methylmalonyl Co-A mutase-associated GTPase MeaB [Alphaproteobacteria bacterium]
MARYVPSLALIERLEAGDPAAIARLISRAEAGAGEAREALARIHKRAGRAHVIGITGVPGGGKSTLVGKLARKLRARDQKVGILAIDPSSPISGGAILGDRIRMSELSADPGIFIRSMATHGASGGLARAALEVIDILDAAGFGTIVIETVGAGQDEVEIARASHTTIVVSAPGLGDDIQAIKAGLLEIADIHVVAKCDRSDADRTIGDLKAMLSLGLEAVGGSAWPVPVIGTSALSGQGLDELVAAIGRHRDATFGTELGRERLKSMARFRLMKTAEGLLTERFQKTSADLSGALAERLLRREDDPYALASELLDAALEREPEDDRDARAKIA